MNGNTTSSSQACFPKASGIYVYRDRGTFFTTSRASFFIFCLGVSKLPREPGKPFQTIGGFALPHFGKVLRAPVTAESPKNKDLQNDARPGVKNVPRPLQTNMQGILKATKPRMTCSVDSYDEWPNADLLLTLFTTSGDNCEEASSLLAMLLNG